MSGFWKRSEERNFSEHFPPLILFCLYRYQKFPVWYVRLLLKKAQLFFGKASVFKECCDCRNKLYSPAWRSDKDKVIVWQIYGFWGDLGRSSFCHINNAADKSEDSSPVFQVLYCLRRGLKSSCFDEECLMAQERQMIFIPKTP